MASHHIQYCYDRNLSCSDMNPNQTISKNRVGTERDLLALLANINEMPRNFRHSCIQQFRHHLESVYLLFLFLFFFFYWKVLTLIKQVLKESESNVCQNLVYLGRQEGCHRKKKRQCCLRFRVIISSINVDSHVGTIVILK